MSHLGRPKKSNNHQIVTMIVESEDVNTIDAMADAQGTSRSELVRYFINIGLQVCWGGKKPQSLIILKEDGEDDWTGFDPDLGIGAIRGEGIDPEGALDNFLNEEETFLEQINEADTKAMKGADHADAI